MQQSMMEPAEQSEHMPTVAERLCQVTSKVERAKAHIADLERECRAFLATNPYRVAIKIDAETRKPIYYVHSVEPIPKSLALIAGDAIQNLMSALDHLAYQLVCSDTGDNPPNPGWIYFPIQDDAAKYDAKKRGKIEGAAQETIGAIDALKPFKGGNDLLWMLYKLNNIEKHRLLLTVGVAASGVNIAQVMAQDFAKAFSAEMAEPMKGMTLFLTETPMPALKPGLELYIGGPGDEPDPNLQFRFTIALSEPGIVESRSLVNTVHQLATMVEGIVTALTPRLKDNP